MILYFSKFIHNHPSLHYTVYKKSLKVWQLLIGGVNDALNTELHSEDQGASSNTDNETQTQSTSGHGKDTISMSYIAVFTLL